MNISTHQFFGGTPAEEVLQQHLSSIVNEISSQDDNYILNVSPEKYAEHLYSNRKFDFPIIAESNYTVSSYEGTIPGKFFPPIYSIDDENKSYKILIIEFHLPFEGDLIFLSYRPSSLVFSPVPSVTVKQHELVFEYPNFYDDPERINNEFKNDLERFMRLYNAVKSKFTNYDRTLKDQILQNIHKRRDFILKKSKFISSLGVPLKSNENAAKSFSVPPPKMREKIIVTKPPSSSQRFVPEPALAYEDYQKIIKIIDDVGRNFERMPAIYKGKDENTLRDFILMVLDPHFQLGSASGETFNKKGKTDILLKYDSCVVFVAECKFWSGKKGFLKTLDQLLSYLTWRDSKTCVVIFVKTREVTSVLSAILNITPTHKCFINRKGEKADNWSEYTFHLPDDPNKEILLTILVFHLPD